MNMNMNKNGHYKAPTVNVKYFNNKKKERSLLDKTIKIHE